MTKCSPIEHPERSFLNSTSSCFLIKRGYIDESYYYYITDIETDSEEEGLLSQNDNAYLLSVKGIGISDEDEMSRHIDDPKLLLQFLIPQDFVGDKILNFDLVHEIIQSKDDKTLELLKHKLKTHSDNVLDFINRYAFLETVNDGFIPLVAQQYDHLWADVENNSLFSNEAKMNLFNKLMKYATINDLVKQNEDGLLADYLRKSNYSDVFESVQADKARQIIKLYNDSNIILTPMVSNFHHKTFRKIFAFDIMFFHYIFYQLQSLIFQSIV